MNTPPEPTSRTAAKLVAAVQTALEDGRKRAFLPSEAWAQTVIDRLTASGYRIEVQAAAGAGLPNDEHIREALWRGHGHDFIYGDDGEMQCNWSVDRADFKRDPISDLLDHCDKARLIAAAYEEES